MYQKNKSSESKLKVQAGYYSLEKGSWSCQTLHVLITQKSPPLPRNFALGTFDELPIVFSTYANLLYLLYSTAQRYCLLHMIKQNCLLRPFLRTLNLDGWGISLPVFPYRTNLKLHNISVTPKMVKKVIMNLDLSKTSGPDGIPVVFLKKCEPERSYILAELFNKCLKESCFLSPFLEVTRMAMSAVSFLTQLDSEILCL